MTLELVLNFSSNIFFDINYFPYLKFLLFLHFSSWYWFINIACLILTIALPGGSTKNRQPKESKDKPKQEEVSNEKEKSEDIKKMD